MAMVNFEEWLKKFNFVIAGEIEECWCGEGLGHKKSDENFKIYHVHRNFGDRGDMIVVIVVNGNIERIISEECAFSSARGINYINK